MLFWKKKSLELLYFYTSALLKKKKKILTRKEILYGTNPKSDAASFYNPKFREKKKQNPKAENLKKFQQFNLRFFDL